MYFKCDFLYLLFMESSPLFFEADLHFKYIFMSIVILASEINEIILVVETNTARSKFDSCVDSSINISYCVLFMLIFSCSYDI